MNKIVSPLKRHPKEKQLHSTDIGKLTYKTDMSYTENIPNQH